MTPMETARKIVAETFDRYEWRDYKDPDTLVDAIAEALQHESNAQLDRDRAVIADAKQTARIFHDAWSEVDGQRCEMLQKIKQQAVEITQCKTHQDFLFNELRKFAEAFKWLDKNHWDCMWTTTLQQPRWVIGNRVTGDEIAEGKTMYEAICNARTALEGEGWKW